MSLRESVYGVWLYDDLVGTLHQRGDHTQFVFAEPYSSDGRRPVLGLRFEQNMGNRYAAALRLPPWFSNLLPESPLKDWIAEDKGVSVDREMELLARVGHDLPGAVRVLPMEDVPEEADWDARISRQESLSRHGAQDGWRFSLAGVALKFSMLRQGDRLTLPAFGVGGDWIVKLPDPRYPHVPRNEYAMMSLAAASGIEVPAVRLVHRDDLSGLPTGVWPNDEVWAYAIQRFDRVRGRQAVHIEDLAQVRDLYPDRKYQSTFETVAALIYRRKHRSDLQEFSRRLAFNVLISNGDAHLKNWSLIYRDRRIPQLSPAYDIVSTAPYREQQYGPEDLGMKFGGTRRLTEITIGHFSRLERKLNAHGTDLVGQVHQLVNSVRTNWAEMQSLLSFSDDLRVEIGKTIDERASTLVRHVP
jgi:serine/threonine-protein kinase HipA